MVNTRKTKCLMLDRQQMRDVQEPWYQMFHIKSLFMAFIAIFDTSFLTAATAHRKPSSFLELFLAPAAEASSRAGQPLRLRLSHRADEPWWSVESAASC